MFQNLSGPVNGFGNVDSISFTVNGISSIHFTFDTTPVGDGDGVGLDNLQFSPTAVPEPSSILLFAGIAGMFVRGRGRKSGRV